MEIDKPFRLSLKLKEGKSHHVFVNQLKTLMADDTSLHPLMKNTLEGLKKKRIAYLPLSMLREIVVDPINMRHFDRSADPNGPWMVTLWSADEIKQHKKDPQGHIKAMTKMFEALGYEMFNFTACSPDYMKMLEEVTAKQIQAQMGMQEVEDEETDT